MASPTCPTGPTCAPTRARARRNRATDSEGLSVGSLSRSKAALTKQVGPVGLVGLVAV